MNKLLFASVALAAILNAVRADESTGEYIVISNGPFTPFGDSYDYVYYVSNKSVPWSNAKTECDNRQLKLLSIETEYESNVLLFTIAHRKYEAFWTSATDQGRVKGDYFWDSTGDSLINFNQWDEKEPNHLGEERCVEIRSDNRKWNNAACSNSYRYICEGFKKRLLL